MTPIFFDPRQSVESVDSYSPSAAKPGRFIEAALRRYPHISILPFMPISRSDLLIAHSEQFVADIFSGVKNNGFENRDPRVPESCLWTIGSLTAAVMNAHKFSSPVCSPTSGFHHACYEESGGFCTFNGLVVAAGKFIAANPESRVGILDLDMHAGNGTRDILKRKPELSHNIICRSSGEHFYGEEKSSEFFSWLQDAIAEINAFRPSVVIYQAGGDMSKYDPLGGLLTDYEMAQRDRMVFSKIRTPMAWNLAGGYQTITDDRDPVINIHMRTLDISTGAPERILCIPSDTTATS